MDHGSLEEDLRSVGFTNPTPFDEGGETVRHDALERNLEAIVDAGGRLIIPCGNTGEYYSLSHEERVAVVETTVEAVGDAASVLAGVGGSTKTALDLIERYEGVGADGVMVMHPVHTYVHERGIETYYRRLVEATDLGVVLYKRGPELTHDHLAALAEYDNVVGVKYADNDVKAFSAAASSIPGVVWSNGIAERFAPSFAIEGAEGYTTGIGNFVPEATLALLDALRAEEWERAREIRDVLRPYEDLREETGADNGLAAANNVPAVKFGMELAGLYGGPVREPLVDLSEADRDRARAYYDRIATADL